MSNDTFIPNTFQTPNAIIDRLMFLLTDSEFRVLMYTVRHILGWQRKAESRRASISLSNFENGFTYPTPNGEASYPGCGLSLPAIREALKGLQKYRIISAIGKPKAIGQEWELRFMVHDDVDFPGLALRQESKNLKRKKQTAKARKNNPNHTGGIVEQLGQEGNSLTIPLPDSPTISQGNSPTINNEIPSKEHRKEQKDSAPVLPLSSIPTKLTGAEYAEFIDTLKTRYKIQGEMVNDVYHQLRGSCKDKKSKRYRYGAIFRELPVTPDELKAFPAFYRSQVTDISIPLPSSAEALENWFGKLRAEKSQTPEPSLHEQWGVTPDDFQLPDLYNSPFDLKYSDEQKAG